MTPDENRLRLARDRSRPTPRVEPALQCHRGHPLDGVKPSGKRYCRTCEIERGRERRGTQKATA